LSVPVLVLAFVAGGMARLLGPTATRERVPFVPDRRMRLEAGPDGVLWAGEGWRDALIPRAVVSARWLGVGLAISLQGGTTVGIPRRCFASMEEARKARALLAKLKSAKRAGTPEVLPEGDVNARWELDLDELGASMLPPDAPDAPGTGMTLVLSGLAW